MNLGNMKKGLLSTLAIFGLTLALPVMADDYTPTLGPDSAYSVSEGTSSDYNFAINDGTNVKYYKMNIKGKTPEDAYHVDLSTTDNGGKAIEMTLPGNQIQKLYYKYEQPDNYTLKENGSVIKVTPTSNLDAQLSNTTYKNYEQLQDVFTDNPRVDFRTGVIDNASAYLYNKRYNSTIESIVSDFISNSVLDLVTGPQKHCYGIMGGAITNYSYSTGDAVINKISGSFIDNNSNAPRPNSKGGAISNYANDSTSKIGSIEGTFISNYTKGADDSFGGAISNMGDNGKAEIGNIKGDFIGNYVDGENIVARDTNPSFSDEEIGGNDEVGSQNAYGGAVANVGVGGSGVAKIETITGNFIGNVVFNRGEYAIGGAIANVSRNGRAEIGSITGDFSNNSLGSDVQYVISGAGDDERLKSESYGGAIGNYSVGGDAIIDSIKGDFISNYVFAENEIYLLGGGGIGNVVRGTTGKAEIKSIEGNFVGNHVENADGGAIINVGYGGINTVANIGKITGDFINNNAPNAKGGAIYNYAYESKAIIDAISGNFIGNSAMKGGAIANVGYSDDAIIGLEASDRDIVFYNNTANGYNDILNQDATVNLNASSGRSINFGGTIDGMNGILNINNGSTVQGGDYIFNNQIREQNVKLFNNASVKLGTIKQADGTTTHGVLDIASLTNDENGGIINAINNVTTDNKVGKIELSSPVSFAIDYDLEVDGKADTIATTTASSGVIKISDINLLSFYPAEPNPSLDVTKQILKTQDGNLKLELVNDHQNYGVTYIESEKDIDVQADNKWNDVFGHEITKVVPVRVNFALATTDTKDDSIRTTIEENAKDISMTPIGDTMQRVVQNSSVQDRTLTATTPDTYVLDVDLGALGGTSLTIDGGTSKASINGNEHKGISLTIGQTLSLNNISEFKNFKDTTDTTTAPIQNNGGTVNVNGATTFSNNIVNSGRLTDIFNKGTVNLNPGKSQKMTLNGGIVGDSENKGSVNITSGDVTVNNNLSNQNVSVDLGGFLYLTDTDVSGSSLSNSGCITVTAKEDDMTFENAVENNGALNLKTENGNSIVFENGIASQTKSTSSNIISIGKGTSVITDSLKNQNILADNDSTLKLTGGDITGTTMSMSKGTFLNINGAINDYTTPEQNNSINIYNSDIMLDVDLLSGTADKYTNVNNSVIKYVNLLSYDIDEDKVIRVANQGKLSIGDDVENLLTTGGQFKVTGNDDNSGTITFKKTGDGGLMGAITQTLLKDEAIYYVTANDTSLNKDRAIYGKLTVAGKNPDAKVAFNNELMVESGSSLNIMDTTIAKKEDEHGIARSGSIVNRYLLNIENSKIENVVANRVQADITNSTFQNVVADNYNGAFNNLITATLNDTSFINNRAQKGALYGDLSSYTIVNAIDKDVEFKGNKDVNGNSVGIYVEGAIALNANKDRTITVYDAMYGEDTKFNRNGEEGTIILNNDAKGNFIVGGGKLVINGNYTGEKIDNNGTLELNDNSTQKFDLTGEGYTTIAENKTHTIGKLEQKALDIKEGAKVSIDTLDVRFDVQNEGNITLTDSFKLNTDIKGGGTTNIAADIQNNRAVLQNAVNVRNGATFKTWATMLENTTNVENGSTLTLEGGKIENDITGTGTLLLTDDIATTNNADVSFAGNVILDKDAELRIGVTGNTFNSANSFELRNNSLIDTQNGGEDNFDTNKLIIGSGSTSTVKMDWGDTFDTADKTGVLGNIIIKSIDLSTLNSDTDYQLTNSLQDKIKLSDDLNILGGAGNNNYIKYDNDSTSANYGKLSSGIQSSLVSAIQEDAPNLAMAYNMLTDETAGGEGICGFFMVQGNSNTIIGQGMKIGSDSIEDAFLSLKDTNMNVAGTAVEVYGGSNLHITAENDNVFLSTTDGSNVIELTKGDSTSAASLKLAGENLININGDIVSDSVLNTITIDNGTFVNHSGLLDPVTVDVNGILNRASGYDEKVTYNINTGSLLNYVSDSTLYDPSHHTTPMLNTFNFAGGTVNTMNASVTDFHLANMDLAPETTSEFYADVDLANKTMDRFTVSSPVTGTGKLNVAGLNLISDTKELTTKINFTTDPVLKAATSYTGAQGLTALSPIFKYNVGYDNTTGDFNFNRLGTGSYSDYNPGIFAAPIAAQLGGYLTQLNSYDQAFINMDTYMMMPSQARTAMKMRNKIASLQNAQYDDTKSLYDYAGGWFRPYATFENVPLHNGPRVSNVMYGSFFGGESPLYDLGHGWDGMWGAYVGYNGSHQAYDGVGIYQNGGTLGLTGMAYKNNFFVGGTVNVGAAAAEASTMYGNDEFAMLMSGVALKTGYNWELSSGKFIIQPSLQTSYSFVNTFNYRNAAGVGIDSDPLHAITIEPGVKFIGNLKNGWQPYAGISMIFNIMDRTRFQANDISLPNFSINPFVKYGVGVRKTWGDRLTGHFQTYMTNGGRNGVGLSAGFRWAIGKNSSGDIKGKTPELKPTKITLNNHKGL